MRVVYYFTATGEIDQVMDFEDGADATELDSYINTGCARVTQADGEVDSEFHYYPGGVKTDRPVVIDVDAVELFPDGTSTYTFSAPAGTEIVLTPGAVEYTLATAQDVEFKSAIRGLFVLNIYVPFPNQDAVLKVNCLAVD